MKYLVLAAGLILSQLSLYAAEPYDSIRNLPSTPYYVLDGYVFTYLISENNLSTIVDVESQDGGVARMIAAQSDFLPSLSSIYSVNGWTSCDPSQKHLFQRFLSNVKQENSADKIIPIRMSSLEAAAALNVQADFISLVGRNDQDDIYNDILAWYSHLSNNGILCGNNWSENSIQLGVTKAAAALDLNLSVSGNVWYFQKN